MIHIYYQRCETFNHWRSFDAHFQHGARSVSLLHWPIPEANASVMTICNQCPLWWRRMQDLQLSKRRWRLFPGWCREPLSTSFDHNGGHFIQKEHCRTIITISRFTVGYLNATINSATWNATPEIGPDGSSQTRRDLLVDRHRAGFGQPWNSGSGFWMVLELNRTIFPVQTQTAARWPGLVFNTNLTITSFMNSSEPVFLKPMLGNSAKLTPTKDDEVQAERKLLQ